MCAMNESTLRVIGPLRLFGDEPGAGQNVSVEFRRKPGGDDVNRDASTSAAQKQSRCALYAYKQRKLCSIHHHGLLLSRHARHRPLMRQCGPRHWHLRGVARNTLVTVPSTPLAVPLHGGIVSLRLPTSSPSPPTNPSQLPIPHLRHVPLRIGHRAWRRGRAPFAIPAATRPPLAPSRWPIRVEKVARVLCEKCRSVRLGQPRESQGLMFSDI